MKRADMIYSVQKLLDDIGMDAERSNERSALTFLALAHLDPTMEWTDATGEMYTTRQIMDWIRDNLGQDYAPNSRETIRRFTLHQFIAGGIVDYNADDPNRAVNSPKNNYRITPDLIEVVHSIGTPEYNSAVDKFNEEIETWRDQQHENRGMNRVPVTMPDGSTVNLSAGGQNTLIKAMVEEFCSRFAPGGTVLYIDDTDHAMRTDQEALLSSVGIAMNEHGKAPDLIVWLPDKQWLFLMEACSTHGPIDVIRKRDLARLFDGAAGHVIYVSCFPDRPTMRKYLCDLAWETEAWCADDPDHMIHLDGEKFLGPY